MSFDLSDQYFGYYLNLQNTVNTSDHNWPMGMLQCFSHKSMFPGINTILPCLPN